MAEQGDGGHVAVLDQREQLAALVAQGPGQPSRSGRPRVPYGEAAGLSGRSILDLLPCVVNGAATPELLDRLSAERARIDRRIGDLVSARDRLDTVITNATANRRTGRHCRLR